MWWKLGVLLFVTLALCLAIVPIRTRAVRIDPSHPPEAWTFDRMLANMYLTPTAGLLIAAIIAVAAFVAFKVLRGQW